MTGVIGTVIAVDNGQMIVVVADCGLNVVLFWMRALAKNIVNPPDGFMCPSGWKVLVEYYDSLTPTLNGKVPEQVPA
ncbi:hypothetical protein LINGRAHAP2_LOCUS22900 [Linum grandiflorum]